MSVRVRFIGDLRKATGTDSDELENGSYTLASAVDELIRLHPSLERELFDEQGRVRYTWHFMVNGRPVAWPHDKGKPIDDDSELVLMRFVAGG